MAPAGLREVASDAFLRCTKLQRAELNEGLERLCWECFRESGLEAVVVPASVREIAAFAFMGCTKLASVSFAEDSQLRTIGFRAFQDTALARFAAPAGLRELGNGAFCNCKQLLEAELNEGLEILGSNTEETEYDTSMGVFENSGLEHVTLPASLRQIEARTF